MFMTETLCPAFSMSSTCIVVCEYLAGGSIFRKQFFETRTNFCREVCTFVWLPASVV